MNTSAIRHHQTDQLTEHVYAIIDSRIQYLEYRASKIYQSYLERQESLSNVIAKTNHAIGHFEQMLTGISKLNKTLKLLTILRSRLMEENARMILYLLTNNKYLNHTEDNLKSMLREKNFRHFLGS